ncbi:MAG: hypothetical protein AAGA80_08600 [Cyanobacteria bacterium P01_F01_bin.143]
MTYLLVPIHLDALFLNREQPVIGSMADFSLLPYFDGKQFQNRDTPYVSDSILSDPLGQPDLVLKRGIHLHWALPDALTKGNHDPDKDGFSFPAVPNRWLITRKSSGMVQERWIVESDYLHPEGVDVKDSVTIAYNPQEKEYQPFRYLGRALSLQDWQNKDSTEDQYLEVLTAVGASDYVKGLDNVRAMFTALYPNARSTFGFYDRNFDDGTVPVGLEYEVLGWYSNPEQDALSAWIKTQGEQSEDALIEALRSDFKWTLELKDQEFPQQLVCYAKLAFDQNGKIANPDPNLYSSPNLTIGNTAIEALSAYLANGIDPTNRKIIEEQLEALQLLRKLDSKMVDIGSKFKEFRHTKGFRPSSGGIVYSIEPDKSQQTIDNKTTGELELSALPIDLATQLDNLNRKVKEYFLLTQEIQSDRQQIFSDWCKYLFSKYNDEVVNSWADSDSILDLIQKTDLPKFKATEKKLDSAKKQSDKALQGVTKKLNAFNKSQGKNLTLEQLPVKEYYQPQDPVILMTGDSVKPSQRHGQDGRLRKDDLLLCELLTEELDLEKLTQETLKAIAAKIKAIEIQSSIGITTWTQQPWNPLMLAWKVEFFPDAKAEDDFENLDSDTYSATIINNHYELPLNAPELKLKQGRVFSPTTNIYRGFSALSDHSNSHFLQEIAAYLNRQLQLEQADPVIYLDENIVSIREKYEQEQNFINDKVRAKDAIYTMLRAYEKLKHTYALSQTLGGLNEALLTAHQAMQLPIDDPLGDESIKPIVEEILAAIGDSGVGLAPYPNDFNPLRAGTMQIISLRLIDSFGQVLDLRDLNSLTSHNILTSELLRSPVSSHPIYLPPRLAQPARLNFQWLSAQDGKQEVSAHPAMTPVCGWIMPNNLDNNLMVYDADGNGLGLINSESQWQIMPGSAQGVAIEDIRNVYLQRVVQFCIGQKNNFMNAFITALDNSLEAIDPESFASHEALALLIGRPLAVVRASIDLEVMGLPASAQNEQGLAKALEIGSHGDGGFSDVTFPIRIGEYLQFNDGLVGYWPEDLTGSMSSKEFFAPQSKRVNHDNIRTHIDGDVHIQQSINGKPQTMTMLLDPRGVVHATSGILPTQELFIHTDHYAKALKNIQAVFSTSPLLMEQGKVEIPLPKEAGYTWSWMQKVSQEDGQDTWTETSDIKHVQLNASFADKQTLQGGWLKLKPVNE